MKQIEDKALNFVVNHYKEHTYHTGNAIKRFRKLTDTKAIISSKRIWTIAASLAIIVCISLTLLNKYDKEKDYISLSSVDRIVTYQLQDGSKITLAPNTTISYYAKAMLTGERKISLKGKAYFSVYHDAKHPFIISTDNAYIQVLGTKFQVECQGQETRVLVNKGKVSFFKNYPSQGIILTQGMGASLKAGQGMPRLSSYSENDTSWATGMFHFDHTPIKKALEEISLYCGVNIYTNTSDKNISGDIEINDAEEAKMLLESLFGIKIYIDK